MWDASSFSPPCQVPKLICPLESVGILQQMLSARLANLHPWGQFPGCRTLGPPGRGTLPSQSSFAPTFSFEPQMQPARFTGFALKI